MDETNLLAGTIQAWPLALTDPEGRRHPLLMVGPVAVVPERQGEGIGHALMAALSGAIDPAAPLPQVMIGDPEYYERFGFFAGPGKCWQLPGPWEPRRLLVSNRYGAILPSHGVIGPDISYAI